MQQNPAVGADGVANSFNRILDHDPISGTFGTDDGIRRFPHFGRRLVEAARLSPGMQVLDVATGRGAVLFPAVDLVGSTGHVVGIDLAPGMVQSTAKDVEQRALSNVEVRQMDAEHLDFADRSFDAILCGFGLMFFPHVSEALAGFRRVLRPGAVLAVSTWAETDPAFAWEMDLWRRYEIVDRHPSNLMAQRLNKPSELHRLLDTASFRDIDVRAEADPRMHADEDEWWT